MIFSSVSFRVVDLKRPAYFQCFSPKVHFVCPVGLTNVNSFLSLKHYQKANFGVLFETWVVYVVLTSSVLLICLLIAHCWSFFTPYCHLSISTIVWKHWKEGAKLNGKPNIKTLLHSITSGQKLRRVPLNEENMDLTFFLNISLWTCKLSFLWWNLRTFKKK